MNDKYVERYKDIIEKNPTIKRKIEGKLKPGHWLSLYLSYLNRAVMSQVKLSDRINI